MGGASGGEEGEGVVSNAYVVCFLLWQVCGVAFSEDGSYFVTAGNRSVKFWYFDTSGRDGRVNTCTLSSFPSSFRKSLGMLYEHHTEL